MSVRRVHHALTSLPITSCGLIKSKIPGLSTTSDPDGATCKRCQPRRVHIAEVSATLRLQFIGDKQYSIIREGTGEVVGHVRRRDSWRLHDWYSEVALGDVYLNAAEETLEESFEGLARRARTRLKGINGDSEHAHRMREQMKASAEILRRSISIERAAKCAAETEAWKKQAVRVCIEKIKEAQELIDDMLKCDHADNVRTCNTCKASDLQVALDESDALLQDARDLLTGRL